MCGALLVVSFVQYRAADEAPNRVIECPSCPINSSRLTSMKPVIRDETDGVVRREDEQILPRMPDEFVNSYASVVVNFSFKVSFSSKHVSGTEVRNFTRIKCKDGNMRNGIIKNGLAHVITKSLRIGPGVSRAFTDVYATQGQQKLMDVLTVYNVGTGRRFTRVYAQNKKAMFMEEVVTSDEETLDVIYRAFTLGAAPTSLNKVLGGAAISSLFDCSARAYDATEDITLRNDTLSRDLIFTHKIDGERMWMVKAGSVWLLARRFMGSSIMYWATCDTVCVLEDANFVVLDIEFVAGRVPVLIDVLSTHTGFMSSSHTHAEAMAAFCEISGVSCPVFVRTYFATLQEAKQHPSDYPCDGLVAIDAVSRVTYKLKSTRSVELRCVGEQLMTEDGVHVGDIQSPSPFKEDAIVEVRFTVSKDVVVVESVFQRRDKQRANDANAVRNVMASAQGTGLSHAGVRMSIVRWCNQVRDFLAASAASSSRTGVIVDLGSGDGKALSSYNRFATNTPVMFVEPDERKSESLRRVVGSSKVITKDQFNTVLGSLSGGMRNSNNRPYEVLASKLSDVSWDTDTERALRFRCKAAVASFSISFVLSDMVRLQRLGIHVFGCGYLYDTADSHGVLVNKFGITMKRLDSSNAEVRWGSDEPFHEAPVVSKDFATHFTVVRASDLVPFDTQMEDSALEICDNVYVIMG